jgi:hypothetical protein
VSLVAEIEALQSTISRQMDAQLEHQRQALMRISYSSDYASYRPQSRLESLLDILLSPLAGLLLLVLLIGALTCTAAGGHGLDYLWVELTVLYIAFIQTPFLCRVLG